jgi:hypothetical protein
MYLRVGSSNRTGTDDEITVRVAKDKSVSASGAGTLPADPASPLWTEAGKISRFKSTRSSP